VGIAAVAGIGGVVAGGTYAASTVTLFGSATLGAVALSVGMVTAPVWPVALGGAAAAVAGGLLAKHLLKKS
jgi:predicted anti-sigma-YlaC factor YlaD